MSGDAFSRMVADTIKFERAVTTGVAFGLSEETAREVVAETVRKSSSTPMPLDWECVTDALMRSALNQ